MITHVVTVVAVSAFEAALRWYQVLFGRTPDRLVADGCVEWDVVPGASIQVKGPPSPEDVGRSPADVVLVIDDLDALLARLDEHGIASDVTMAVSHQFRIATVVDEDANRFTLVEDLVDGDAAAAARGW